MAAITQTQRTLLVLIPLLGPCLALITACLLNTWWKEIVIESLATAWLITGWTAFALVGGIATIIKLRKKGKKWSDFPQIARALLTSPECYVAAVASYVLFLFCVLFTVPQKMNELNQISEKALRLSSKQSAKPLAFNITSKTADEEARRDMTNRFEVLASRLNEYSNKLSLATRETRRAKQGKISYYYFDGLKEVGKTPGNTEIERGQECTTFNELVELDRSAKWSDIIDLATSQIAKTPEWLTPHFYRARAKAFLGKIEDAKAECDFIMSESDSGDQVYGEAQKLYGQIETKSLTK